MANQHEVIAASVLCVEALLAARTTSADRQVARQAAGGSQAWRVIFVRAQHAVRDCSRRAVVLGSTSEDQSESSCRMFHRHSG
jgi:hypothetical protein